MSVFTTKEIMEIIPHRQPFLLVDTIEEMEPGKRAVGKKYKAGQKVSVTGMRKGNEGYVEIVFDVTVGVL